MKIIEKNIGKDCIYIYNLTRKTNIAFIGKVNYFGCGLIILIPKKIDINEENDEKNNEEINEEINKQINEKNNKKNNEKNNKNIDLNKIKEYMNSDLFKNNFLFSGRFKIGHRQISNSYIPNNLL
jgi:adenine-specific DNA-methyltransferase